jgi:hypothetical protein
MKITHSKNDGPVLHFQCRSEIKHKCNIIRTGVFWVVVLCSLVGIYRRFTATCCLHHQGDEYSELQPRILLFYICIRENLKCYYVILLTVLTWSMKTTVFWDTVPCSVAEVYCRFRGACCLNQQSDETPTLTRSFLNMGPVTWRVTGHCNCNFSELCNLFFIEVRWQRRHIATGL